MLSDHNNVAHHYSHHYYHDGGHGEFVAFAQVNLNALHADHGDDDLQ